MHLNYIVLEHGCEIIDFWNSPSKLKLISKQISQLSLSLKSLQAELQALVNSNYFSL